MRVINAGYEILSDISPFGTCELMDIEQAARTCYRSEDRILDQAESAKKLVKRLITSGHEAMLEHGIISVRFTCDRGISHELVRHRMASFAQESTRYCNYSKDKFHNECTFIEPPFYQNNTYAREIWYSLCMCAEGSYKELLNQGFTPEQARGVLPNSLATRIVVTANYREWRHILKLRTAPDAHPQMRELMIPLLKELKERLPIIFDDILPEEEQV